MNNDELIQKLGASQQNVMHLTVVKRRLEARVEMVEERAEVLEELVMEVADYLQRNVIRSAILDRIRKVMQTLDGEDQ